MIRELIDLESLIQNLDSVLNSEAEEDCIEIRVVDVVFEQIVNIGFPSSLFKHYENEPLMIYGVRKELKSISEIRYRGYRLRKISTIEIDKPINQP